MLKMNTITQYLKCLRFFLFHINKGQEPCYSVLFVHFEVDNRPPVLALIFQ